MRLFSVRIGIGHWIVRAADAGEAEALARAGSGDVDRFGQRSDIDQRGATAYGVDDEYPATVVELHADGPARVLDHDYG